MKTDQTFEEQVNEVAGKFTKNDEGKLVLLDDVEVDSSVEYAAKLELRRRDTQSAFSKIKNENSSLQAENAALAEKWQEDAVNVLTNEEKADLEELKTTDLDGYIKKVNDLKEEATTTFGAKLAEVKSTTRKETELARRTRLITEYNEANPEYAITDEVINNDLPPRLVKQFGANEITFDQFIEKASIYLKTPKTLDKGTEVKKQLDLSKSGGRDRPSEESINTSINESYEKTIF